MAIKPEDLRLNGWNEYKRLVLHELERLDEVIRSHDTKRSVDAKELRDLLQLTRNEIDAKLADINKHVEEKQVQPLKTDLEQNKVNMAANKDAITGIKASATAWAAAVGVIIAIIGLIINIFIK